VPCVDSYLCASGLEEIAAPSAMLSTYLSCPEDGGSKRLRNSHSFSNLQGVMPHSSVILVITTVITSNDTYLSFANIAKTFTSAKNLVGQSNKLDTLNQMCG
jgi:hypothetical protein